MQGGDHTHTHIYIYIYTHTHTCMFSFTGEAFGSDAEEQAAEKLMQMSRSSEATKQMLIQARRGESGATGWFAGDTGWFGLKERRGVWVGWSGVEWGGGGVGVWWDGGFGGWGGRVRSKGEGTEGGGEGGKEGKRFKKMQRMVR